MSTTSPTAQLVPPEQPLLANGYHHPHQPPHPPSLAPSSLTSPTMSTVVQLSGGVYDDQEWSKAPCEDLGSANGASSASGQVPIRINLASTGKHQWIAAGQRLHPSKTSEMPAGSSGSSSSSGTGDNGGKTTHREEQQSVRHSRSLERRTESEVHPIPQTSSTTTSKHSGPQHSRQPPSPESALPQVAQEHRPSTSIQSSNKHTNLGSTNDTERNGVGSASGNEPRPEPRTGPARKVVPDRRSRDVLDVLTQNGFDHLRLRFTDLTNTSHVGESELRAWLESAGALDQVFKLVPNTRDWYITFKDSSAARYYHPILRQFPFLHHTVKVSIHPSPSTPQPFPSVASNPPPVTVYAQTSSTGSRVVTPHDHDQLLLGSANVPQAGPSATSVANDHAGPESSKVDAFLLDGTDSSVAPGIENAASKAPKVPSGKVTSASSSKAKKKTVAKPQASKPKPLAGKQTLKRPLKDSEPGPPRKKSKTSATAQASSLDVDRDLMAVLGGEPDAMDEEWDFALTSGESSERRRTPPRHHQAVTEEDVLDLEAALTMDIATPVILKQEPDVDVEAELLAAVGGDDLPGDAPTPAAASSSSRTLQNGKHSRGSSPVGKPIVDTPEVSSTGRVRKKIRNHWTSEPNADLDELIPLPPPPKKKKGTKAKHTGEKDLAYQKGKGAGHKTAKPKHGKAPHPAPAEPSHAVTIEGADLTVIAPLPLAVTVLEETVIPDATVALPPPPPPKASFVFRRPDRPRIPTLEEAMPQSPPPVAKPELVDTAPLVDEDPSLDPVALGLAMDDEELFFLKAGLSRRRGVDIIPTPAIDAAVPLQQSKAQLRVHRTGSARSEGYYKIADALKSTYLPQRNRAMVLDEPNTAKANAEAAGVTGVAASSRSNRINTRRLVQGMEQVNKAMGDTQSTQLQFNQLRARKKQLIFARSPIHDWGLYAMEAIPQGEMVIEYVGEVIRAQVADKREKWYERIGIGSSYLFRVDEDSVVDATKRGNLGRLINHSCTPNCNAKIIVVNSQKKIVIYAKTNIEAGEEITYDYHFPLEQEKIPCLCGSARCRGFLN